MIALRWLLDRSQRISKIISKINFRFGPGKIRAAQLRIGASYLEPGYIILTRADNQASNLFIPGFYTHAAIVAKDKNFVIESTMKGVVKTDIIDFLISKDNFLVMRPLFASRGISSEAAYYASTLLGKPYDFSFRSSTEAYYCFELIFAAYQMAMEGQSPWKLRPFLGEPTVLSSDFLSASSKWESVVEF